MTRIGYKKIQRTAISLLGKYIDAGLHPKMPSNVCAYCGGNYTSNIWEHRSYDDPIDVVPACCSCNKILGPASLTFFHVGNGLKYQIRFKRVVGGRPPVCAREHSAR